LCTVAMFWPALALASRSARQEDFDRRRIVAVVSLFFFFSLFFATPLFPPLLAPAHFFSGTPFSLRLVVRPPLMGSLLLALSIPFWTRLLKTRKRPLVIVACGTVAMSLAFSFGHIVREARWLTSAQFEQTLSDLRGSRSIHFWLPVWADNGLPEM